jgi:hypothetical protein
MPSYTTLQWGTFTISSDGQDGVNYLTALEGWEGTPQTRIDDEPRPNTHGSFVTPVWAAPRIVKATGFSLSDTARDATLQALGAAMQVPGAAAPATLAVTTASRSLTAAAQLTFYAPVILTRGFWQAGHFPWTIEWRCPDPLRYGATQTVGPAVLAALSGGLVFPLFTPAGVLSFGTLPTPGTLSLSNTGNADAPVILTVAANGSAFTGGFQIIEAATGQTLRYAADLAASDVVVFDSSYGTVTLNGTADRRGSLTIAQWTTIPAGQTRTFYLAPLGGANTTASLTASTRPTYW